MHTYNPFNFQMKTVTHINPDPGKGGGGEGKESIDEDLPCLKKKSGNWILI